MEVNKGTQGSVIRTIYLPIVPTYLIKQIHQKSLASAYPSIEIEPFRSINNGLFLDVKINKFIASFRVIFRTFLEVHGLAVDPL